MTHEEIIKDMRTLIEYFQTEGGATPICMEEAIDIIHELDAAPAVKEAEWARVYDENEDAHFRTKFYCSACGEWNTYGTPAYCMHCGAKMRNGRARK